MQKGVGGEEFNSLNCERDISAHSTERLSSSGHTLIISVTDA